MVIYQMYNQQNNIIIKALLMGRKKFNKKESVRYSLVPSKDEKGNPMNLFQPIVGNSHMSPAQRKSMVKGLEEYEVEIDGKTVHQQQIPAYILEQIKGRSDLIFNQKNPHMMMEEEQMEEEEEYDMQEEQEEWGSEQWEQQEQSEGKNQKNEDNQVQDFVHDGKTYKLTKKQMDMLEQVLPEDYDTYFIEGIQFAKFDDDGNRLDKKHTFAQYMAEPQEKRAVIDSHNYVPEKPLLINDNDLKQDEIKGDMKQIQEALNYEGDQQAYEQIQDDFFAKLLGNQVEKPKQKKKQKPTENPFKKKNIAATVPAKAQNKKQQFITNNKHDDKWDDIDEGDYEDYVGEGDENISQEEQITDEMVEKAIEDFDKLADMKEQTGEGLTGLSLINFIESREDCLGRDGELDWRTLTKKQKKQYMKNKKIRSFLQELREREVAQKTRGIKNVSAEELHLKQYIESLPYNEDHVIQEAIKRDAETIVDMDKSDEQYETDSEEDDIISYRAKTSIISSNLATVEEFGKKKRKPIKKQEDQSLNQSVNIERVKVIPERRTKLETPEERKARKQKLKDMKKKKRDQRTQFNELFEEERKKAIKGSNHTKDTLHKVSYVKIV